MKYLRLAPLLFVLISFSGAAAAAPSGDWPGFRGPNGNGQLEAGLPTGVGEPRLRVRWQRALGSGYSGISLAAGVAVTGTSDAEHDLVMAFDPDTGEARWTAVLGPLTVGVGGSKDGPIATPAVSGGRVFMVSTDGRVVALDLPSGELLWSTHLVRDLGSTRPIYGFSTSAVVVGDVVVVQAGGQEGALVGLEAESGALRWRTFSDGHYAQSPIVTELAGRRQVVAMGSTRVVGVDPESGEELWGYNHGGTGEFGAESASPMPVGRDRLFVKHDNERTSVVQIAIRGDETLAAEVTRESRTLTRSYSPPTLWEQTVYGYTSRFMSALDLETGDELWRSRAPGDGFLMAIEGLLFVATKNGGTAHLAVASREGWNEIDQVALFDDIVWTPPSFADSAFYVRSLTEVARVDLTRSATTTTGTPSNDLPLELRPLRDRVAAGGDPSAPIDALLAELDGPLVDGERVLFLWRGDADEVGIAGDMFGFRYDEPMHRLAGTDLWWWQTELDRRGRFNYVFFPDYEPALDARNPRTVESTAMGPDLNHRAEEALQMSWFTMPDWPGHRFAQGRVTESTAAGNGEGGRLENFVVEIEVPPQRGAPGSAQGETRRVEVDVTVWLPPGYAESEERYPTVMALERYAIPIGNWPATLDLVVGDRVAPLIAIMIDPPAGFYGRRGGGRVGVLVPGILAEVDRRYRTIGEPEGRAVTGALYTAPPAIALTLGQNRLFARIALQSPFSIDAMLPMFSQQIESARSAPPPVAFYFEWAHWDMRSRGEGLVLGEFMRDLYDLFVDAGYDLIGGEVWDSTDWAGWRNRTGVVLEALFPASPGGQPEELDAWLVEPLD